MLFCFDERLICEFRSFYIHEFHSACSVCVCVFVLFHAKLIKIIHFRYGKCERNGAKISSKTKEKPRDFLLNVTMRANRRMKKTVRKISLSNSFWCSSTLYGIITINFSQQEMFISQKLSAFNMLWRVFVVAYRPSRKHNGFEIMNLFPSTIEQMFVQSGQWKWPIVFV